MTKVEEYIKAKPIFDSIPKIRGEARSVEKCPHCDEMIGRQFIPYGLGRGRSFGGCMCVHTQHILTKTILYQRD